jgi:voltage-gated potassium channel Kch
MTEGREDLRGTVRTARHAIRPKGTSRWRVVRWAQTHPWWVVVVVGGGGLILGYVGFDKYFAGRGESVTAWDILYLVLQLIPISSGAPPGRIPWELSLARFLVPAVSAYAALSALALVLRDQIQRVRLRFVKGYTVVCGAGRLGTLVTTEFSRQGQTVVVIDLDRDNPNVETCRQAGAVVVPGDATRPEMLRAAGVERAKVLLAVCGSDAANAEVAAVARRLVQGRRRSPLSCVVRVSDPRLTELLRDTLFSADRADGIRLEMTNFDDLAARAVLRAHPMSDVGAGGGAPEVIIVGAGSLATSLISHLARSWRARAVAGDRLTVKLIGTDAKDAAGRLRSWFPHLEYACEVRPIEAVDDPQELARAAAEVGGKDRVPSVAYICMQDGAIGLAAGLALERMLPAGAGPIVVCVEDERGLARLLRESGWIEARAGRLTVFPLAEHVGRAEVVLGGTHETVARAIHDEYVRARTELGETPAENHSLAAWEVLPEPLRDSNRRQADHIHAKLEALSCGLAPLTDWDVEAFAFTPDEIERLSKLEHARWVEDARLAGWRHATGAKDPARKTHPSLVPWESLPDGEKDKDRQAVRSLPRLVALAGLQIYRKGSK